MLTFDFKNVFAVGDHGLSESFLSRVPEPSGKRYSFYDLPENEKLADEIVEFARGARTKFDHFVLLGIGGSALGARCIADALASANERGRLIILDNIDPALLSNATAILDLEHTLFLVVSKSGGTPETVAQYFYFRDQMNVKFGARAAEHFVLVTDPEKGFLRKIAREEKIRSFEIPPEVGGRFSVLSACGLLPAALLGIDIHGLLRGAAQAQGNAAHQLAAIQFLLWKERGVPMTVMMPYSWQLSTFSDWYVQLLSESIGKEKNLRGETVNVGLTPVKAVGVTDQHSQVQLFTSGPFDKFLLFIEVLESNCDLKIPAMYESEKDFSYLHSVSFHQLLLTEKRATEQALTQYGRPNATVKISKLDSEHLGMLFMFFQESVAFLGELHGIDAFDQPGVELGKVLTKRLLS